MRHTESKNFLKKYNANALPHASLICGKEGYGGLAIALDIAQILVCSNLTDDSYCNSCESCLKQKKLLHPDVHFSFPTVIKKSGSKPTSSLWMNEWRDAVLANNHLSNHDWLKTMSADNKQGNLNVAECREITKKLGLKSFQGGNKVTIIWMADFLGANGNRLLKLIEEPPENTYILLIAEKAENILGTIKSRTQITKIKAYTDDQIRERIVELGCNSEQVSYLTFMAEGDLNKALKLLEEPTDNDMVEDFRLWMQYCVKNRIPNIMKWSDVMATKGRDDIKYFIQSGIHIVRECVHCKTIPDYTIRLEKKYHSFVNNFSKFATLHSLDEIYKLLNATHQYIGRNANSKISLFQLSLNLNQILTSQ